MKLLSQSLSAMMSALLAGACAIGPSAEIDAGDLRDPGALGESEAALQNEAQAGDASSLPDTGASAWEQDQPLFPDPLPAAAFGSAVAVRGGTIAVGAHRDDQVANDAGAIYLFVLSGDTWTLQAKITVSGQSGDLFGHSVALSADGNTLVAGAPYHDAAGVDAGAAYIFQRTRGSWVLKKKLTPDGPGQLFGTSVTLDEDAITAAIGAPRDPALAQNAGSAYVFARASGWELQQKLYPAVFSPGDDEFGSSLGLSGDTLVAGAPGGECDAPETGMTHVFYRQGGSWIIQSELCAPEIQSGDRFGASVAVSDGIVAVGSPWDDDGAGSVHTYQPLGGGWSYQAKLTSLDPDSGDLFGASVSVSGDMIAAGATGDDEGGLSAGAVYGFMLAAGVWTQEQKVVAAGAQPDDAFGYAVAVDGPTLVAGRIGDDTQAPGAGAAHVLSPCGPGPCF
jgi:hypothetical protein